MEIENVTGAITEGSSYEQVKAGIPRRRHEHGHGHPREDPRRLVRHARFPEVPVGEDVGVGVVECQLK